MRCFVAIDLTAPERLRALAGAVPAHLHLTLRFLGEVPEERSGALGAALLAAAPAQGPFELELRGIGAFPEHGAPRVVWVGVGAGAEPCRSIAAALEDALAERGFGREERPFTPHVTLTRVRGPRDRTKAAQLLAAGPSATFGTQPVDRIVAYASVLRPDGAEHRPIAAAPLTGAAP